jgi:hypothetical protein
MTLTFPKSTMTWPRVEKIVAAGCVRWLRSQGFDVLSIWDGPRIIIRSSPLCDQMEDAVEGYSRSKTGEQRYKTVIRCGCEVRWKVGVAQ